MKKSIVDMHCHLAGIGAGGSGCFVSDQMEKGWRFLIYLNSFGVTKREVIKNGDMIIAERLSQKLSESKFVDKAIVFAMDGIIDKNGELDRKRTEFYIPNEYILQVSKKYPNLLYGASINPYRKDAINRLEQVAKDGGKIIKWIPSIQLIDPADEIIIPFYIRMKELGMFLLSHVGDESSFTRARNYLCDPVRLKLPLSLDVSVIAPHMASSGSNEGQKNIDRLISMFIEYPNLRGDISSLTQINRLLLLSKVLNCKEVKGRLLYGTDMPLLETPIVSPLYHIFRLPIKTIISIYKEKNPWDRDVLLKKALGFSDDVFTRPVDLLKI